MSPQGRPAAGEAAEFHWLHRSSGGKAALSPGHSLRRERFMTRTRNTAEVSVAEGPA